MGLIGHTGSGKSTLIQHLNGLLQPTGGTVLFNGADIFTEKKEALIQIRHKIGLVFQYPEHQLFEETVEKDVSFGPKNLGLDEAEISRRVKHAIKMVGLNYEKVKDKSPFELSGGQMRQWPSPVSWPWTPMCSSWMSPQQAWTPADGTRF